MRWGWVLEADYNPARCEGVRACSLQVGTGG